MYRKTVFEGQKVNSWTVWETENEEDEGTARAIILDIPFEPGESEETYTVTDEISEDGIKRWVIEVDADDARDGRYDVPNMTTNVIQWGRLVSGGDVIEIGEILISESFFEGTRRSENTLLIEPLLYRFLVMAP